MRVAKLPKPDQVESVYILQQTLFEPLKKADLGSG